MLAICDGCWSSGLGGTIPGTDAWKAEDRKITSVVRIDGDTITFNEKGGSLVGYNEKTDTYSFITGRDWSNNSVSIPHDSVSSITIPTERPENPALGILLLVLTLSFVILGSTLAGKAFP